MTDQPVVEARNAAMWLARQIDYTVAEIGRAFGGRDDADVQSGIDSVDQMIRTEPEQNWYWLHRYDFVVTGREPPDIPEHLSRRNGRPRKRTATEIRETEA
jgi:hypothetical protein